MTFNRQLAAVALAALLVGSTFGFAVGGGVGAPTAETGDPGEGTAPGEYGGEPTIDRFDSRAEFVSYVRESGSSRAYPTGGTVRGDGGTDGGAAVEEDAEFADDAADAETADGAGGTDGASTSGSDGADRHSETNVQEAALDEPDVLKTDGETVYYADRRHRHRAVGDTTVLDAAEPGDPAVVAEVPASGEMLLVDDSLVVFERDSIEGFDVSDPADPDRSWEQEIEGRLEAARLYDGDVYLVVASRVRPDDPCPVTPLGPDRPDVDCTDVHYPADQNDADAVYTTLRFDPATGEVDEAVSFLGSSRATATYVSENAVYLTYADAPARADLRLSFLLEDGREHLDDRTIERLERLRNYDLSDRAADAELRAILDDWRAGLDEDERRQAERNLEEAWESYASDNLRKFTRTGVVKVSIDGSSSTLGDSSTADGELDTDGALSVDAAGTVPGAPLDQFSMDEHEGHLRIATTVGAPGVESENDLYVLDSDLDLAGSVTGMGVDERIYSVRYEGDTAYVVTFREIDPFHVIDVSDPHDPVEEGELELPGFSTYMHPLGDDRVLGIGEENGTVKAVIFDASDPENPVVEDDEILDDRWSAVRESHNAFLVDERHGVFFLPGSEGGHVFAYEDGLERVTTVDTGGAAMRAMYLDDYLYVFGEGELVVVDERTWDEETRVGL